MRNSRKFGIWGCLAVLAATPGGCAPTKYENASHPAYGPAQYESDNKACETANTKVTTRQGYDIQTEVTVDPDGVKACLLGKGWRPVGK